MKSLLIVLLLLAAVLPAGCTGVMLSAEYSRLLDQTAALSAETAKRAEAGTLTQPQMVSALRYQADCWATFRDARDGRAPGDGKGDK